jgi:hypothetical protein
LASPRQQSDVPRTELGFGGAVSRDPSAYCSRRNACSGRIVSGEALADDISPAIGDSEILLARMKELIRNPLARGDVAVFGRLRNAALLDK